MAIEALHSLKLSCVCVKVCGVGGSCIGAFIVVGQLHLLHGGRELADALMHHSAVIGSTSTSCWSVSKIRRSGSRTRSSSGFSLRLVEPKR